jgi:hypothetical protein
VELNGQTQFSFNNWILFYRVLSFQFANLANQFANLVAKQFANPCLAAAPLASALFVNVHKQFAN